MKKVYLVAVVFALVAGFATFLFANEISERASYADAKKVTVVTAITDVPQNTTITQDNYATYFADSEVVSDYVLKGAVTDSAMPIGTVTRQTVYAGEQLTENKLITADSDDATLSLTIPDGYVAYPISGGGVKAADGYISIGDKVDVYTFSGSTTTIPLKDLEVLRVSTNSANVDAENNGTEITEYSTLTLVVTEEQAVALMDIENGDKEYKLVLKPRVGGSVMEKQKTATTDKSKSDENTGDYQQVD